MMNIRRDSVDDLRMCRSACKLWELSGIGNAG